jgi:hypothetical protein
MKVLMSTIARLYAAAPADTSRCAKKPVAINILDGAGAPGLSALQHLINILALIVLSLAALCCLGGLSWIPLGKTIGVHGSGQHGRIMVVGGLAVAFLVGLIAVLINLAYSWGSGVTC